MENTNNIKRSDLYNEILEIVKQIPREKLTNDAPDAPSVAYTLEQLFLKNSSTKKQEFIDSTNSITSEGLSCGLEDVGITDRYEAMEYGFEQCKIRVEEGLLNVD